MRRPAAPDPLQPRSAPLARVGWDPELEADALARTAAGDERAAFRALHRLVSGTDLDGAAAAGIPVAPLLLDLLLRVDRRLFPPDSEPEASRRHRQALLEALPAGAPPAELAERFLATLRALFRERRAARPPAADAAAAAARHPAVRGAIAHVRSHYARRIPLAALAAELHVSPSHLSRLFRRETGTTLTAFVQQVRLEHARRLLERDDATLAEIAYRVGFQNYRDFYRNWVKREKASPRAVRRRLRARAARRTPDASCG